MAGVLLLWALLWRHGHNAAEPRARRPAPSPAVTAGVPGGGGAAGDSGESPWFLRKTGTTPPWGSPEFTAWVREHCAEWLEKRGRDGPGLVALWDLTGEEALLREAAEKHPDDLTVCATMTGYLLEREQPAGEWARKLSAMERENPAGRHWWADLIVHREEGDGTSSSREFILNLLKETAESKRTPDDYLKDRVITAREALLAGGADARTAAEAPLAEVFARAVPLLGQQLASLHGWIRDAADPGKDVPPDVPWIAAAVAERLRGGGATPLANDISADTLLLRALRALPPDAAYGDSGGTVGERLAEVAAEFAETHALISKLQLNGDFLAKLTDPQMVEYADQVILHGESAALRWLDRTLYPPPPEPPVTDGKDGP